MVYKGHLPFESSQPWAAVVTELLADNAPGFVTVTTMPLSLVAQHLTTYMVKVFTYAGEFISPSGNMFQQYDIKNIWLGPASHEVKFVEERGLEPVLGITPDEVFQELNEGFNNGYSSYIEAGMGTTKTKLGLRDPKPYEMGRDIHCVIITGNN